MQGCPTHVLKYSPKLFTAKIFLFMSGKTHKMKLKKDQVGPEANRLSTEETNWPYPQVMNTLWIKNPVFMVLFVGERMFRKVIHNGRIGSVLIC